MAMGPGAHIGHAHSTNSAAEGVYIEKEALDLLLLPGQLASKRRLICAIVVLEWRLIVCLPLQISFHHSTPTTSRLIGMFSWPLSLLFSKVIPLLLRKLQNCQDLMKECLTKDAIS